MSQIDENNSTGLTILTYRVLSKPSQLIYLDMHFFTAWLIISVVVVFISMTINLLFYGLLVAVFLYFVFRLLNLLDPKIFRNISNNSTLITSNRSRHLKLKVFDNYQRQNVYIGIKHIKENYEK